MSEFKELIEFVQARQAVYQFVIEHKEKALLNYQQKDLATNVEYDNEARAIKEKIGMIFGDIGRFYMSLAQLYQFGEAAELPNLYVHADRKKAAYWLLWALKMSNKQAFLFLHSLVPECFVPIYDQKHMTQVICYVFYELERLYPGLQTVEDCIKTQPMACILTDIVVYKPTDTNDHNRYISWIAESVEKHVEPYIVTAFKSN